MFLLGISQMNTEEGARPTPGQPRRASWRKQQFEPYPKILFSSLTAQGSRVSEGMVGDDTHPSGQAFMPSRMSRDTSGQCMHPGGQKAGQGSQTLFSCRAMPEQLLRDLWWPVSQPLWSLGEGELKEGPGVKTVRKWVLTPPPPTHTQHHPAHRHTHPELSWSVAGG